MNFRRVYQIFWCKSLTFNETTSHQHHEIRRQTVANKPQSTSHHRSKKHYPPSLTTPNAWPQRKVQTQKRGWCRMLPTSECDFDNLKIELSSANLDLIIEKTKLLR